MARLYADENFPVGVARLLRRLSHDVLTTHEAGRSNQGICDEDVLAHACSMRRAILTHNRRDYIRLHRRTPGHWGIVVCTEDPDDAALAARIDEALGSKESLRGELLRVVRPA